MKQGVSGGVARMTEAYPNRRITDQPKLTQMDNVVFYNHLKYRQRVLIFFKTKRKRIFLIALFINFFFLLSNLFALQFSNVERFYKKQLKDSILGWRYECVTTKSALDSRY
mmetsp:Transcript_978/g.1752  ORF Transcript_978/g.1752 Transcript_978/m.1752 type:complete len:111 (-) Transcript_978:296-628(-)